MDIFERFRVTLGAAERGVAKDIDEYIQWMTGRQNEAFKPTSDDEVAVRAYLLHLRVTGIRRKGLERRIAALRRLYGWAEASDLIEANPLVGQDFDRRLLSRNEIQRRKERLPKDKAEREIAQLRGLNELAQQLNRAADVRSALDATLPTVTKLMDVETAWIFLLPEVYQQVVDGNVVDAGPTHDFAAVAAHKLPPGLEQDGRYFLCAPPDCHCQGLAREGRLKRALNIVECTRAQDAALAEGDVRGLFFHASVPLVASDQLLGIINVATREWQLFTAADLQLLSIVGATVAAALERANLFDQTRMQRERFEKELEMARQVQASLLPQKLPEIPGFEIATHWHSAREVAGDFYDVFPLGDDRIGLVIGDVSDKGAPAALYMAMARSFIRASATSEEGPARTLRRVNEDVMAAAASDMFVTVFYGILDPTDATLTYAGAGHDPPVWGRTSEGIEWLMPTGPLLGVYDDLKLEEKRLTLAAGDKLLLYTDGVTDALNEAGEEYGREGLIRCMAAAGANALLETLHDDLMTFVGEAAQLDDITLLAVTRQA